MAWYYGTYSCGHDGRENIIGPTENRQWIADRKFEGLCPECWEKKKIEDREKANAAAAEKAKEMELPPLEGTEKQVAWANTLRQNMINKLTSVSEKIKSEEVKIFDREEMKIIDEADYKVLEIMQYIIVNKTKASWYIDNRHGVSYSKILKEMKSVEAKREEDIPLDIDTESTVRPEKPVSEIPAEIKVLDNEVIAVYERNDKFREIVKFLGYEWDGAWKRTITETTGSAIDRAAELGNKLLNAGFPVKTINNEAREKAVNGTYELECKRWIYIRQKGDYKGWFAITWDGMDDRLYNASRRLSGSKWSKPSVVVRVRYFNEVAEFAELFGFRFTVAASDALKKAKAEIEAAAIVYPVKVGGPEYKDGLKEILNSGSDIIDDLKD